MRGRLRVGKAGVHDGLERGGGAVNDAGVGIAEGLGVAEDFGDARPDGFAGLGDADLPTQDGLCVCPHLLPQFCLRQSQFLACRADARTPCCHARIVRQ